MIMLEKIEKLLKEINTITAKNVDEVEQLRLKYLSKKGMINTLMVEFRNTCRRKKSCRKKN